MEVPVYPRVPLPEIPGEPPMDDPTIGGDEETAPRPFTQADAVPGRFPQMDEPQRRVIPVQD